jgi:hypothetical protein
VPDEAVLRGLVTGQERTFHQDPLFAFRLLADIGLRALSPAVNDPATAVQVLDTMQSILSPLVTRDPTSPISPTAPGPSEWCWPLARRRQPRPRMSSGRKFITTSAVCG